MLKHLWFDFGGTLYNENTPEFQAAHDDLRFQLYANLKGLDDLEIAKQEYLTLYEEHGSNSRVFTALGKPSDYWMQNLENLDFAGVIKPDPEISKTLPILKELVPISLFTNFKHQRIEVLFKYLQIPRNCFTHILSGDDIINRKPALDGFYKMIQLSSIPPEQIMYVGDRVDVDITPAKQLGMLTCMVYGRSDEADYCINNFAEIEAVVKRNL